jgi:hypothetical protein
MALGKRGRFLNSLAALLGLALLGGTVGCDGGSAPGPAREITGAADQGVQGVPYWLGSTYRGHKLSAALPGSYIYRHL